MTNYYIEKDNKIVLFDEDRQKLINTLSFLPQYEHFEILETEQPIVNFQLVDTEEHEKHEQDKINHLKMTALDLINVLDSYGFTLADRQQYFSQHPEVQEQLMYCQNVYCGVVRQLCPITINDKTITDDIVVQAFKNKHNIK